MKNIFRWVLLVFFLISTKESILPLTAQPLPREIQKGSLFFDLSSSKIQSIEQPPFPTEWSENDLLLMRDVGETAEWRRRLIASAQQSIEFFSGYVGGAIFLETLELIEQRIRENPCLVVTFYASEIPLIRLEITEKKVRELIENYPTQFRYRIQGPVMAIQEKAFYTTENHLKLLIIDGLYFLTGGTNLVDFLNNPTPNPSINSPIDGLVGTMSPKGACDNDVVGRGPLAMQFRKEFYAICDLLKGKHSLANQEGYYTPSKETLEFPLKKQETIIPEFFAEPRLHRDVRIKAAISGPRRSYRASGALYREVIDSARSSLFFANLYFFPAEDLYNAFIDAVNRNIKVNGLINGGVAVIDVSNFSSHLYTLESRAHFLPILSGTKPLWSSWAFYVGTGNAKKAKHVNLYEIVKPGMLFHKKVLVADEQITLIGSYNLGGKSEYSDYEIVIMIDSPEFAHEMLLVLEKDRQSAEPIAFQDAVSWYFNPIYRLASNFEAQLFDGIII